jgi:hypothetical protein
MVMTIRRMTNGLECGFAAIYPQDRCQIAPKKRLDITIGELLVHISCTDCNATVIPLQRGVGACNQNLSQ